MLLSLWCGIDEAQIDWHLENLKHSRDLHAGTGAASQPAQRNAPSLLGKLNSFLSLPFLLIFASPALGPSDFLPQLGLNPYFPPCVYGPNLKY